MKAPISVCIIVKNEPILEPCLQSLRDYVEEIVVVDTGSTDNTPEVAKKYADIFVSYTGCNDPATGLIKDFSKARDYAFSLSTKPWVMWADADDIIVGADKLANLIQIHSAEQMGVDTLCFMFPYEYSYNDKGECICIHYRERLVSNHNLYKWVNPVHEVLIPKENTRLAYLTSEDVIYKHQRQYSGKVGEPGRNLRILEEYIKEHGDDARQHYYLGLEYYNCNKLDLSYASLEKYIGMSGWDDEKCMACLKMVDICYARAQYEDGVRWAFKAVETKENWCECYFALAKMFYFIAQKGGPSEIRYWQRCAYFAKHGLSLPPTKTLLFVNPQDRDFIIHQYLNVALGKLGDIGGALESVNAGLFANPTDPNLLYNKNFFENIVFKNEAMAGINKLQGIGHLDKITVDLISALVNKQAVANQETATTTAANPVMSTNGVFPRAIESENPQTWTIPKTWDFEGYPLKVSNDQLQAMVIAVWKQYMLHDEVLSAISFLEHAPYMVKHSAATEKALAMTKATIAWMDDLKLSQSVNSPANFEVEAGKPLPNDLDFGTQEANRFYLVADNLEPAPKTIVDFGSMDGCFTNRYGMRGYKVTGLDLSETSVRLANKKAAQFNTNAKHIVTYFKDSANVVTNGSFDYATSTDTYEHLKDPVNEMLIPAKKMLKPDGKFLLVTPHGAWMRGEYLAWAHPWVWSKENGTSWLAPNPRGHLIAPSAWTVAEHFRQAGYWVKNSYPVLCEPIKDVNDQGNIFTEACMKPPFKKKKSALSVVFYIGDGLEAWTPASVKKNGIGGSEIAAIEMAKRLALQGHRVRVYVGCGKNGEGIYDGVEYYTSDKYMDLECDVLIVSRMANMLDDAYKINAKIKLLWCHDMVAVNAKHSLLLKADRILALSEWHKQNLIAQHNLNPNHIIVTRNGIDLERFAKKVERNKFKVVNSSSPDRSWPVLLDCWADIKARVPQAELHLFYGFKNWKVLAQFRPGEAETIQRLEAKIASLQPQGVIYRDRLPQKQLAEEFLSSGVIAYPTWFSETSCITMMEAQAAGLRIVTSSIAALNETVADRGIRIDGEWTSPEYKKQFVDSVVAALEKNGDVDRVKLQKYAKEHFSWDTLGKEWEEMFYQIINESKKHPVVPYMPIAEYQ